MNKLPTTIALALALAAPLATLAKLPPPSPEAQAKADEAKAKAAWSAKVKTFEVCKAQNSAVQAYIKAGGKPPATAASFPPCTDPGPYAPR